MTNLHILNISRPLILVTASPARRMLVANTGLKFATNSVEINEMPIENERAEKYVERLSIEKSKAFKYPFKDALIITVDTAIDLNGEVIGKPIDEDHARLILKNLSDATHDVVSSIAVRDSATDKILHETTITKVIFENLNKEMIDWYISTLEWKGRAGAYAIQGKGSALIKEVHGCFTNVIGISIPSLFKLLKMFV